VSSPCGGKVGRSTGSDGGTRGLQGEEHTVPKKEGKEDGPVTGVKNRKKRYITTEK